MGAFASQHFFSTSLRGLRPVVEDLEHHFRSRGYEIRAQERFGGTWDISVTEKAMFKAICGLKTALNIELAPVSQGVAVKAGIGIFGQQIIPALITAFLFWPVIATQIWGLVKQSKLDEEAIRLTGESLARLEQREGGAGPERFSGAYCSACGEALPAKAGFCPSCGVAAGRVAQRG